MSRTVVITGAASGIGLALARHFIAAGDCVAVIDPDSDALAPAFSDLDVGERQRLIATVGDVGDEADVRRFMDECQESFGVPDVIVNNAGITGGPAATTLHETPVDVFDRVVAVNLRGPYLICRRALPGMVARGSGIILNIASVAAFVAFPGRAVYSMTKAALAQLTRTITADYAAKGVRSVALCPGMVATPMTQWRLDTPRLRDEIVARIPQGRVAAISDIVAAVSFLVSADANYFNGSALPIDGGYLAV